MDLPCFIENKQSAFICFIKEVRVFFDTKTDIVIHQNSYVIHVEKNFDQGSGKSFGIVEVEQCQMTAFDYSFAMCLQSCNSCPGELSRILPEPIPFRYFVCVECYKYCKGNDGYQ